MRGDRSIDRHRHEGGSSGRHRWPGWFATRRYHGHGHAVLPQHRRCWGPASVTTYDKDLLLKAVLDGKINPGKVFTKTFTLDEINDAYQAMADRQVIKSYVKVSD